MNKAIVSVLGPGADLAQGVFERAARVWPQDSSLLTNFRSAIYQP